MKNKVAYTIVRIILGLAWVFFGAMKFVPQETSPFTGAALAFMTGLAASGYFMPFLGISEVLVGLLLLVNRAVPFSMILASALMINIILFTLFLAPGIAGFIMLLVLTLMQAYIMYCTWDAYKPLFISKRN